MKYVGQLNEEDLKLYRKGTPTQKKEIKDKYVKELFDVAGPDSDDVTSLSTGLRRIQYKFIKANTPAKYTEVFGMVASLVANFPLKSKIIWKAVIDAYGMRFGSPTATAGE
jgi:hypothetical protein